MELPRDGTGCDLRMAFQDLNLLKVIQIFTLLVLSLTAIRSASAQTFSPIASLTLPQGEYPVVAAIDTVDGFAYFGTNSRPGSVVKVDLSSFNRVGAVTLKGTTDLITAALLDPTSGFGYFGTGDGYVVKIRLSDMTQVGAIEVIPAGSGWACSALMDASSGFAYFGLDTGENVPGRIGKVRLSDFSLVDTLTLETPASSNLCAAVIDTTNGYAYFGTDTKETKTNGYFYTNGYVFKIRLADFKHIDTVELLSDENLLSNALLDTRNGFAYFATGGGYFGPFKTPGVIIKIRLADFARVDRLTLPSRTDEEFIESSVIDSEAGFAYFGTYTDIFKVRLSDFSIADNLTDTYVSRALNFEEYNLLDYGPAVIDPARGYAYFASHFPGGATFILKFDLTPKTGSATASILPTTMSDSRLLIASTAVVLVLTVISLYRWRKTNRMPGKGKPKEGKGDKTCPSCGIWLPIEAKFCDSCGTKQT